MGRRWERGCGRDGHSGKGERGEGVMERVVAGSADSGEHWGGAERASIGTLLS